VGRNEADPGSEWAEDGLKTAAACVLSNPMIRREHGKRRGRFAKAGGLPSLMGDNRGR